MQGTISSLTYSRGSGVLMPVTMLHGPFGIGVLGKEALEFIDFLYMSGFSAWQMLPVEHTGMCFSPYKCISSFAGEPMLIDPGMLFDMGLITGEELSGRAAGLSRDFVDYESVHDLQWNLLRAAYSRLEGKPYSGFQPFWLESYALFMALKDRYDNKPWYEWPDEGLRGYDEKAVGKAREELGYELGFYRFVQWLFHKQWLILKDYAAERDLSIIGDIPFYVSEDSVEVWSERELFDADINGSFSAVGGAPPDYFNPNGQCWGNPVYNWELMKKDGYNWWIRRIETSLSRYNLVRLDHFRGFESYWSIPSDAPDARSGEWVKGPGSGFFDVLRMDFYSAFPLPLIAEDLGVITEDVDKLLIYSGLRGMRVLQFGFLGDEKHLPHNYPMDCVAYTGTHDNTTLLAWLYELSPEDRERALFYVGFEGDWTKGGPNCDVIKAWIRMLFTSAASLVIIPIQDLLGYGADTRTNVPGTTEGNWRFRIHADALGQIDAGFYKALNEITGRSARSEQ